MFDCVIFVKVCDFAEIKSIQKKLSYSIQNFDSGKEVAVIRMLSDTVKYEILKLHAVMDPISDTKKMIPSGTYAGRELLSMLEGIIELNQFEVDDQVIKTNKLKGITEMIINLDELNNSDTLIKCQYTLSISFSLIKYTYFILICCTISIL